MENLDDKCLSPEGLVEENLETCIEDKLGNDNIVVQPSARSFSFKSKKCLFFVKTGFCKFGRNCNFLHGPKTKSYGLTFKKYSHNNSSCYDNHNRRPHFKNKYPSKICQSGTTTKEKGVEHDENLNGTKSTIPEETSDTSGENSLISSQNNTVKTFYLSNEKDSETTPVCYYFKKGYCYRGDNCKFYHQKRGSKYSKRLYLTNCTKDSDTTIQTKLLEIKSDSYTTIQEELLKTHSAVEGSNANNLVTLNKGSNVFKLPSLVEVDIYKLRELSTVAYHPLNVTAAHKVLFVYSFFARTQEVQTTYEVLIIGKGCKSILLKVCDYVSCKTTEISQLKKRFPHCEEVLTDEAYTFMFEPTDPDWPFDVRKVKLEVNFPKKYPQEKCVVTVLKHAENFPDLLIKFLNNAISGWIVSKYEENHKSEKIELVFRPFLKWLDKNLEELFIGGLRKVKQDIKCKEDGIEFVPFENLFPSSTKDSESECSNNKESDNADMSNLVTLLSQTSISTSKPQPTPKDINIKQLHYVGNNIMKVLFPEFELIEGAAALICTKVSITSRCCRCKSTFHAMSVPRKNHSHVCSKCSRNVGFTFDPFMMHQFSNVLGNLYLLDCLAVDINLVECHFLVDCLNCCKQVSIEGIHYGQKHKLWCTSCHGKMTINIGCIKFQTIRQSAVLDSKNVVSKKNEKKFKNPVIKEGEPLPDFGACKHFKKSFRWLRFPCCGRLYPCDECHNEKETDHEMKYASRMICGFCSKEQPYSREKPCLMCSQNMTKKSRSHWEGGKGCRNKIQMSREDNHKYAGACKTVSKKAQNLRNAKNKS